MNCDEVKPLLNARLDDEVERSVRDAVDSHVKACATCGPEFERLESVRDAVRSGLLYNRAPAHLRDQVRFAVRGAQSVDRSSSSRGRSSWAAWGAAVAAIALLALASASVLLNGRNQSRLVAGELVSAHERALMGTGVDVISSDRHTVKPWYNGKLPFSPPVADLAAEGFPLQGGRLDYIGGRPVAVLVYGRRLHRIDVFVWPAAEGTKPPSRFGLNGYNEISWSKDNFLFTAVSDVNTADLTTFAGLLQR